MKHSKAKPGIVFGTADQQAFFKELRQRVDDYFESTGTSKFANPEMVVKSVILIGGYLACIALQIVFLPPTGWSFALYVLTGFFMAGIGMSVMHDANHGAYSSNENVNRWVGYSLNLVGGTVSNWKTQHNVLHHTYTNIYNHDKDIDNKIIMRFSPAGEYKKIQKFQVFYVFVFYSIMSLYWTTAKDFVQYFQFIKEGHNRESKAARVKSFITILVWKAVYWGYIIVLPTILLDLNLGQVLLGFLSLHMVAGLILSIVFQLAHVVEDTQFPMPNKDGGVENEWAIHQLNTTADFARDNALITFYVGGLNFQSIHHLFPQICHVHYPKIAPIIEQTAKEFDVPYLCNESIGSAFLSHMRVISKLGKNETTFSAIANSMG